MREPWDGSGPNKRVNSVLTVPNVPQHTSQQSKGALFFPWDGMGWNKLVYFASNQVFCFGPQI